MYTNTRDTVKRFVKEYAKFAREENQQNIIENHGGEKSYKIFADGLKALLKAYEKGYITTQETMEGITTSVKLIDDNYYEAMNVSTYALALEDI